MAAAKDNILSFGFLTGTERDTFTKQREHRVKKSVNRPMLLQTGFSNDNSHQQLRAKHLQQRWQELKERELTAQQHNRQLLQQFEEAQDTLREMLTLTAAMKTIRVEYERYLEESSPRWQQQLKEKTQAAQRKKMEEYLRSSLKNTEEQVTKSSADRPLLSQGPTTMPQTMTAPLKHYSPNSNLDYNQDGSPHLPYMQSSWQTRPQSQTVRFPIRPPYQPQGSSHVPPSFLPTRITPHPHSFQLHQLASTPSYHQPRSSQNPPGWASLQPNYPWSWAAGAAGIPSDSQAMWGQLYTEEPPPETEMAGEEADTSRAPWSKRERRGGGRSSHLSQELDVKPVRLSGGHAESSESSRESSKKRKKREERGRSHCSSSDRESCNSQESSRTSSAIVVAAVTVAQSSESDASSDKGRTSTSRRRSGGLAVGSPRAEKAVQGSKGVDSGSCKEESQSTSEELESLIEESRSEKVENESPDNKSQSCGEEPGSQREEETARVSEKIENRGGDEMEKPESSSSESEQSSVGEKDEDDLDRENDDDDDAGGKENCQTDEEQEERDVEDDEASERKNTTEEEEETGAEDEVEEQESEVKGGPEEQSDRLKKEDGENGKKGSASSQDEEEDEDESEGEGEDNMEEDGESDEEQEGGGEEEEEQRGDKAGEPEEESDSDDSIISPHDKSKKMHIIPEEASEEDDEEEEEDGSKTGSSDDDDDDDEDDDVEHLLAPQERSQKKEEKDPKVEEKPKAICDNVEIFRAEPDKSMKSDHPSDSDEFDHFYG